MNMKSRRPSSVRRPGGGAFAPTSPESAPFVPTAPETAAFAPTSPETAITFEPVAAAYARRPEQDPRYHPLNPAQMHALQERERALAAALRRCFN